MCPPVDDLLYIWMWLITIVSVYTIVHNGGDHDNEDDIDDSWMVKVMNERCVLFALAATKSRTWLPVLSLEQVKTCENKTTGRHVRVWCCRHRRLCGVGGGGGGSGGSENEAESGVFFVSVIEGAGRKKIKTDKNRTDEEWRVVFFSMPHPSPLLHSLNFIMWENRFAPISMYAAVQNHYWFQIKPMQKRDERAWVTNLVSRKKCALTKISKVSRYVKICQESC